MIEEWVELTDGNQKLVMTRRELRNLAHRVSCIFATASNGSHCSKLRLRAQNSIAGEKTNEEIAPQGPAIARSTQTVRIRPDHKRGTGHPSP